MDWKIKICLQSQSWLGSCYNVVCLFFFLILTLALENLLTDWAGLVRWHLNFGAPVSGGQWWTPRELEAHAKESKEDLGQQWINLVEGQGKGKMRFVYVFRAMWKSREAKVILIGTFTLTRDSLHLRQERMGLRKAVLSDYLGMNWWKRRKMNVSCFRPLLGTGGGLEMSRLFSLLWLLLE